MSAPPRILAIAGSDSSGGAGIQADIKTITMLGGYAMTAITAVTAQNTRGVAKVELLSPEMVGAQIDACLSDIGADAVKIGMLGSPEIAAVVAERLDGLEIPIVFDPVMVATSGSVLADADTIAGFERLMALATLTTPNLPELEALSGLQLDGDGTGLGNATEIVMGRTNARAMLAKGGHAWKDDLVADFLFWRSPEGYWREMLFEHERIETRHTHGTGCTLSSAIATYLGMDLDLPDSVGKARQFVRAVLLAAPGFGSGYGPLGHQAVR